MGGRGGRGEVDWWFWCDLEELRLFEGGVKGRVVQEERGVGGGGVSEV